MATLHRPPVGPPAELPELLWKLPAVMLIKLVSNDYWWDLDDAVVMEIDTADIFSLCQQYGRHVAA